MIAPDDIMNIAVDLANGKTEAHLRSAVSRAYYAVFHEATAYAEKYSGYKPDRSGSIHRKLSVHFIDQHDDDIIEMGYRIQNLHKQRKTADYDLDTDINQNESKFSVAMAKVLIQELRKLN